MGFREGAQAPTDMKQFVGSGDDGPAWMRGGTYLVARRIRIALEHWHQINVGFQEQTVGRKKKTGAPLGAKRESDPLPLAANDKDGNPIIAENAHVYVANAAPNNGAQIYRRSYSYNDGEPRRGTLASLAPSDQIRRGPLLHELPTRPAHELHPDAREDGDARHAHQFATHVGSGIFAIPPGATPSEYIGQRFFTLRRGLDIERRPTLPNANPVPVMASCHATCHTGVTSNAYAFVLSRCNTEDGSVNPIGTVLVNLIFPAAGYACLFLAVLTAFRKLTQSVRVLFSAMIVAFTVVGVADFVYLGHFAGANSLLHIWIVGAEFTIAALAGLAVLRWCPKAAFYGVEPAYVVLAGLLLVVVSPAPFIDSLPSDMPSSGPISTANRYIVIGSTNYELRLTTFDDGKNRRDYPYGTERDVFLSSEEPTLEIALVPHTMKETALYPHYPADAVFRPELNGDDAASVTTIDAMPKSLRQGGSWLFRVARMGDGEHVIHYGLSQRVRLANRDEFETVLSRTKPALVRHDAFTYFPFEASSIGAGLLFAWHALRKALRENEERQKAAASQESAPAPA